MTKVTTGKKPDAPETDAAEHDSVDPRVEDASVEPEAENASVEPEAENASVEPEAEDKPNDKKSVRLHVSISLRSFLIAAVIVALVGAVGVLAWLYVGAQRKLDEQTRRSENNAHAEKVALDYAVNAAAMNFQDLNAWKVKLIAGTSPELKEKLTQAAASMEQILVPLEWSSTARPLAAKVRSVTGGAYVVDSFVGVLTKTVQSPDPLQSTATYSVTIDSAKNWQITDVGGIGSVVEQK
jgi:flagellar basal body-associated protein FliL